MPDPVAPVPGVVLVHGLYHDPQHFDLVARELRAEGIEVVVPELHRGSLPADTQAVQAVTDAMDRPPLVLGHSYGGSVITGLTGAAHLVYVAAFVPAKGESAASLGGSTPLLVSAIMHRADGATHLDPVTATAALFGDCSAELAAWAVASLRPQGTGCGRGVPQHLAWRDTPSTYVVCTADHAIDPSVQVQMSARCRSTRTWPTSHSPFLSRPDLVAELISELLEEVRCYGQ